MSETTVTEGETRFDREIHQLKEKGIAMGQFAVAMLHDGWSAFEKGDLAAAQAVLDRDSALDLQDEELEHAVIAFLVVRRPAAKDLRMAAALLKISTHIDRIGRLGFDIARLTTSDPAFEAGALRDLFDGMESTAESMVQQAIEVLREEKSDAALQLIRRDDEVDRRYRQATRMIVRDVVNDPLSAAQLTTQMLVARHLERIADNACKIAEKTIYAVEGKRRSEILTRHPYLPYAVERRGQ